MTFRNSRRGLVGALLTVCLLLLVEAAPVHAGNPQPLSLSAAGTVLNAGTQTYSVSGGTVISATVDGQTVISATLTFAMSAQVTGLSTSGTASFDLTGTTTPGGQSVTAAGTVDITNMAGETDIPIGCTTTCNSALPLFFVGGSATTVTIAGTPSASTPVFDLESPYFNPWGAPIVLAAQDGSITIVTTYDTGTIQWQGTETGGAVSGTLGSSPVSGALDIVSQENEDLVRGTASDSGTITLSDMNASVLDVQGTYTGTSTIPTAGELDCSADLGFPPAPAPGQGVCTQTGFQSSGQAAMQNAQIGVTGTYSAVWGVPALGFTSSLSLSYVDDPAPCTPAVVRANPDQGPTIGFNGSPTVSSLNATNTLSFYVTMPDALPAAWLAGGGCMTQDAASFSQLNVTRVAYTVDGGPLQNATFSFTKHGEFECSAGNSMTLMDTWQSCTGSLTVVKIWSGSVTFTVMPTGLHQLKLEAWGQNGVGPFTVTVGVYHSLYSYTGQPFVIAAQGLKGQPVVVKCTGLEPMLTTGGIVMVPISYTYHTVMPQSGVIYGSFVANGHVTVAGKKASEVWAFTLGNNPQRTQQLSLGGQ